MEAASGRPTARWPEAARWPQAALRGTEGSTDATMAAADAAFACAARTAAVAAAVCAACCCATATASWPVISDCLDASWVAVWRAELADAASWAGGRLVPYLLLFEGDPFGAQSVLVGMEQR